MSVVADVGRLSDVIADPRDGDAFAIGAVIG